MARHTPYNPGYPFRITSHFGKERHRSDETKYRHVGVDFGAPIGTGIPAASEGRVVYSNANPTYGNAVIIEHVDGWGKNFYTLYAHMKGGTALAYGSHVKAGEKVGEVGETGRESGPHVHFELLYPDGNDSQGPYFLNGRTHERLNTGNDGKNTNIGVSPGVGRRDPETYAGYGGDVFAKGHPKYRLYRHGQHYTVAGSQTRTGNGNSSHPRHSPGGQEGYETLERHGDEVTRVEPDGSTRGSFHSE